MLCAVILGLLTQLSNTASVEGVVARLGTGEPLARATVTLSNDRNASQILSMTTDAAGRFSFLNVPPGEYRLQAYRQGPYIPAEYGQRKPDERGTPIAIQAGQKIIEIRLELAPTSSISGRILDSDAEPVGRAEVQALQSLYQDGHKGLKPVQTVLTNDLGEYRLRLLQPGRYYIRARVLNPQDAEGRLFIRPPAAPLTVFQGTVIPYLGRRALENGAIEEYLEAPVYFPGVIDPGLATPLELHVGENPGGFDFTTASGHLPARRIRGKIINSVTGQPAGTNASIVVMPRTGDFVVFAPTAQSAADGSFEIKGVATGSYFVFAALYPTGSVGNPLLNSGIASARIPIEIGDSDLENLSVVVVPNFKIPVRLVFDGNISDPAAAMRGVQLTPDPPIGFGVSHGMKSIAGGVGEIEGIGPGDYRISRSGAGYIQSARLGSADVLKEGLHLDHQPEDFLEVVIGGTTASVEGRVTDGTQAVSNAVIVLVPSPNLRQRSDRYYVAATDGNGRFQIQPQIVPGEYKAFAWKDIEPGAWQDPEVLQRYENQGQPVSVTSDSKLNIDLRLVR
jgi:protocatechuate 3,4-dioxygenase beta subunit